MATVLYNFAHTLEQSATMKSNDLRVSYFDFYSAAFSRTRTFDNAFS